MNYDSIISWFELPSNNLERATKSHETLLDTEGNRIGLHSIPQAQ